MGDLTVGSGQGGGICRQSASCSYESGSEPSDHFSMGIGHREIPYFLQIKVSTCVTLHPRTKDTKLGGSHRDTFAPSVPTRLPPAAACSTRPIRSALSHVVAILLAPPPSTRSALSRGGDSPGTPSDSAPDQNDQLSHVVAILLAPPLTQRYFTGAVAEGVSGELQY